MGESIKAEVRKEHGAVPMVTAPVPVPLNKRGIPRMPVVTFENTIMPSTRSRAHGNKLFLLTSTAVDTKKQEVFKPIVADFMHPVDESFQVYHGHAGLILGKHPPIPAVVTAGVESAPGTECMTELGDLIKKLAKRFADELMGDPIAFYRNYSSAHDTAAYGAIKDKASGIGSALSGAWDWTKGAAGAVWNDPLGTAKKAGGAIADGAVGAYEWGKGAVNAAGELIGDAADFAKALWNGEITVEELMDELEAMLMEMLNALGCAGRDLAKQMLEDKTPLAAQIGAGVGAAKANIAMEVAEGVLVSKGLGTAAKIGAKLAPLAKHLGKFNPKTMMQRIKARRNKPRDSKPTPTRVYICSLLPVEGAFR